MIDRVIGIRREDKSIWEKRTPLIPEDVMELKGHYGINTIIQPSKIRVFKDEEYKSVGAELSEHLDSKFIFGVKEMPVSFLERKKTYVFFSHTIKGQAYNMSMLKQIIELEDTLIDYERIVNDQNRRLVAFGRFAGIAGMIDTLWALGKRFEWEGYSTPFLHIKRAYKYQGVKELEESSGNIGREIKERGFSKDIAPIIIGIAGYGNVSHGVQEVLHFFPVKEVSPQELLKITNNENVIYKAVFKEEDIVKRKDNGKFGLQDYYDNPDKYYSIFQSYLPYLTVLVNAIYWDKKYPRLVTKDWIKNNYTSKTKLKIIGDISCDIEGAIEITKKATEPDEPVYIYNPKTEEIGMGFKGKGPVIFAVDILPSEVSRDASIYFSHKLKQFIPEILKADYPEDFSECSLPPYLKRAVIVYRGKLTQDYRYLEEYLKNTK